jgi:hypothetical protein
MARDSYEILLKAGGDLGRIDVPWRVIEPFITRFNSATTERAKLSILGQMESAIAEYLSWDW